MKARKVHTKIWRDEWFSTLSRASKLLFVYLITNEYIGLSGFVELTDRQICFDTGLSPAELEVCKQELLGKVNFSKGWLYVVNYLKNDPIEGDTNNLWKAYEKEIEAIPNEIKKELEGAPKGLTSPSEGSISIGIGKGIGKERESVRGKTNLSDEVIKEVADKYSVSEKSVKETYEDLILYCKSKGKTYKDYEAALMTWVRNNIKSGKTKIVPQTIKVESIDEFTDEQRQNNLKRLAEMRAKLPIILHQ